MKELETSVVETKVDKHTFSVLLPVGVAEYLKLKKNDKVFFTLTDGVVQISAKEPKTAIPVLLN